MLTRMRRAIVTSIRQTRDRLEAAQSVAALDDMSGDEITGDILGRPRSSIHTSLRRLHVNLGHTKNKNTFGTHSQQTWKAARNFGRPACEAAKCPRVARQSSPCEVQLPLKSIAMDVQELPGWMDTRITIENCTHVICEGSSMHSVVLFGDNDSETFQWLSETVHSTSDEFMNWCEQQDIEVVGWKGKRAAGQGGTPRSAD